MRILLAAIPFAIGWGLISDHFTLSSLVFGYIIGLGMMWALRDQIVRVNPLRLPVQVIEGLAYLLILLFEILQSGIDVARRVLSPKMNLKPGIIAVPVQDDDQVIAALSALSITITPGQLVVDFDGSKVMYVHCLDVEASAPRLDDDQRRRLSRLRRILGK